MSNSSLRIRDFDGNSKLNSSGTDQKKTGTKLLKGGSCMWSFGLIPVTGRDGNPRKTEA